MTIKKTADLHCHLNGSFSLMFLKETARKNGCSEVYKDLKRIRADYLQRTSEQPQEGFPGELIKLVWDQFELIHKIIQDLTDISEGVVDVVTYSEAKYLEIRTTPKPIAKQTRDKYIDAFESGLVKANTTMPEKKALGLLSLDRTMHNLDDARYFIDRIKTSTDKVLVGLDISGNPRAKRTLTGETLGELIQLTLNNGVPIAIHMGESDSEIERNDTDTILSALENWKSSQTSQDKNPLYGKVRLGHCIYLTDQQKERIAKLRVPIEVCPTCHSKLNWHLESEPHPVTTIYKDLSDPIVVGTDDEVIFGASTKFEFNRLLSFFSNNSDLTRKELKEHQSDYRFSAAPGA